MENIVNIKNYQRKLKIEKEKINNLIHEIFKILNINKSEISFIYVTPEKISFFNENFRKVSGPTDVLSFPDGEKSENGFVYLGDVVISPKVVKENSKIYNNGNFKDEFILVHVHAILHLLGYTHGNKTDMEKMFSLQEKIKEKIKEMQIF